MHVCAHAAHPAYTCTSAGIEEIGVQIEEVSVLTESCDANCLLDWSSEDGGAFACSLGALLSFFTSPLCCMRPQAMLNGTSIPDTTFHRPCPPLYCCTAQPFGILALEHYCDEADAGISQASADAEALAPLTAALLPPGYGTHTTAAEAGPELLQHTPAVPAHVVQNVGSTVGHAGH
jgi:hypothetical protein